MQLSLGGGWCGVSVCVCVWLHTYSAPVQTKKKPVTNLFSFSISHCWVCLACRDDGRACVQAPTISINPPHPTPHPPCGRDDVALVAYLALA